ncbi:hypothetical protein GLOIN_2v1728054 [Rhizophagus irregularis DAOM 181602=DAOM 197198]|uniref:Uncharacterized protein n=1 Tax=Rhizophagus irregularis (strain DAOM 181602 / DAOM 197198 / MUCL 43194) TaxID=747089 RepID=A0A2P4P034_RHIID|nr:hypothetical protein GLOIN_2v1728054 [Rhizophagus irregularis DAOM 181602=DAOM 197198]POG58728.1 hypothetical protein GLOIN_2v1728054 [Rhizophagus irregularis DAOM 181602=DAOM 197198]|eukprot:XP_025165594.1 hypothetical protein GLOIN_2v1728054 [Rhizophagus irregularis DAOM 181602=DAOM 197198]
MIRLSPIIFYLIKLHHQLKLTSKQIIDFAWLIYRHLREFYMNNKITYIEELKEIIK